MDRILGIDLGTTNSVAAIVGEDGKLRMIEEDGQSLLPSVVGLDEQGRLLVGTPARNQFVLAPERTVRSIKRRMGEETTVKLGDTSYSPQEISAIILRTLKERAERVLGHPIQKAVITVPAFFNETQREATRAAGELAGLEVVRIINEPTAAALTYEPHPTDMERLLVYDLGGGTFDVSIVQIEQGVVEVLASHGDTHLGGDDFDQLLVDYICDDFKEQHDVDLRKSLMARSRVLAAAEEAKKLLSNDAVTRVQEEFIAEKDGKPLHLNMELDRIEYEGLIGPMLEKTLKCVDDALDDAKLVATQINQVVLVGGSSRTPLVHRLLHERLSQPLHTEINPDLCVAMGAAVQGGLISGCDVGPVLVDITPHTLGIAALSDARGMWNENGFAPIIERNSALPINRSEIFGTCADGQEAAEIRVFQGESDDVRFNEKVGEFKLEGLADVERGNEILVRFALDLDGILKITATERSTGLERRMTIDSAMERFRRLNRDAAGNRLEKVFATVEQNARGSTPGTASAGTATAEVASAVATDELQQLIRQAEHMLVRGEKLAPQVSAEDAGELQGKISRLREAIAARSEASIKPALAELDDLVFYLQDN